MLYEYVLREAGAAGTYKVGMVWSYHLASNIKMRLKNRLISPDLGRLQRQNWAPSVLYGGISKLWIPKCNKIVLRFLQSFKTYIFSWRFINSNIFKLIHICWYHRFIVLDSCYNSTQCFLIPCTKTPRHGLLGAHCCPAPMPNRCDSKDDGDEMWWVSINMNRSKLCLIY